MKTLPEGITPAVLLSMHNQATQKAMATLGQKDKTRMTNLKTNLAGKTVVPSKPKGIGKFCVEKIKEGLSNDDILKAVAETFEGVSTSIKCIRWYRCKVNNNFM